jgi:hypothetical protein
VSYTNGYEYELAERKLSELLQQYQGTLLPHDWLTLWAWRLLACVYRLQKRFRAAEALYLEIIEISIEETGEGNGTMHGIYSCRELAWLYDDEERDVEAERYFSFTLDGAMAVWVLMMLVCRRSIAISRSASWLGIKMTRHNNYVEIAKPFLWLSSNDISQAPWKRSLERVAVPGTT